MTTEEMLSGIWPEWKLIRQLGKGSYGAVYEAVRNDYAMESKSAIKVIDIPQDESEVDSLRADGMSFDETRSYLNGIVKDFVSEIQLMGSFKGVQNIVSAEDYYVYEHEDQLGWTIFIRMELLTPLNTAIGDAQMSSGEVMKLGIDICSALEICARQNVIHRDIKPENIFVNQYGDYKLGDFGVAKKVRDLAGALSQKGTYNYMAPEIEKGVMYDATADIYSLGLVLYRFYNKKLLPFLTPESQLSPNERVAAVRKRLDGEPLPPPCDAPPVMASIILKACAYDPKDRFPNAREMRQAIEAARDGKPVQPVKKSAATEPSRTEAPEKMRTTAVREQQKNRPSATKNRADEIKERLAVHDKEKKEMAKRTGAVSFGLSVVYAIVIAGIWIYLIIRQLMGADTIAFRVMNLVFAGDTGLERGVIGGVGVIFAKGFYVSAFCTLLGGGAKYVGRGFRKIFAPERFAAGGIGVYLGGIGAAILLYWFFTGGSLTGVSAGIAGAVVALKSLGGLCGGAVFSAVAPFARVFSPQASVSEGKLNEKMIKLRAGSIFAGMGFGFLLAVLLSFIPFSLIYPGLGGLFFLVGILIAISKKNVVA
ncbi:MAG: protein kinase [Lachnospiraceae bacterium]|nr:protein kinase [Lachnospiraceae bacterium]